MCIDDQMLSAYLDGELKEPYLSQTKEHLSYCHACSERLEGLSRLSGKIRDLKFDDEVLCRNKGKVFSALEEKYFSSTKRKSFFWRKIEMSLPSLITAAAAVVFIFVGGFMFFGSNAAQTEQILPSFSVHANSDNIQFVSQHTSNSLEQYSVEEILDYLDSLGYEVEISLKSLNIIDGEQ